MESRHSADGEWWWSGAEWLPAWSADRRSWFDGLRWTRNGRYRLEEPTGREFGIGAAWLLLWALSLVWSAREAPGAATGTVPDPTGVSDNAAGAGVVILAIPALLLIAVQAAAGTGLASGGASVGTRQDRVGHETTELREVCAGG